MHIEQLAKEVMNLSLEERAELAQRLLISLDETPHLRSKDYGCKRLNVDLKNSGRVRSRGYHLKMYFAELLVRYRDD